LRRKVVVGDLVNFPLLAFLISIGKIWPKAKCSAILSKPLYNLGILSIESETDSFLELRCVMLVRSNYAPWTRNDHSEVMLGDMATFTSPEETAFKAREFWK
jgi:hypothetical protein